MPKSSIKSQVSSIHNGKIAIVTDWVYGGGGELVVEALHDLYPEAPIYTSYCSDEWRQRLHNKVITGYLQRPPFRQLRRFLPLLRQWWFKGLDLSNFDMVISITGNGEAKFVRAPNGMHVSYCHTPVHFYWRHYTQYLQHPGLKPAWLARLGLRLLVKPLRNRDYAAAQKVDHFIANSTHIQADIKQYYNRDSAVVFPPVDIERFAGAAAPHERRGFVTHGRLVPYKRVDLIIEACNQLKLPLTIIGKGPDMNRLQSMAGSTITFAGFVSDEALPDELARHEGYIFAAYEDFGISPVEAMAAGLPVIAFDGGGARDYVSLGKTGEFFMDQSVESLIATLNSFNARSYSAAELQQHAETFSKENFLTRVKEFIGGLAS